MRLSIRVALLSAVAALLATLAPGVKAQQKHQNSIIDIWSQGKPVFGVYVPAEGQPMPNVPAPPPGARGQGGGFGGQRGARPDPVYSRAIGEALAKDPLIDFAFLNLEGEYDASAVRAIVDGLRSPGANHRVSLLVRIPSIQEAGADKTRVRVKQILDLGADGVVHPENRGLDDAKLAVSFYQDMKADVWSPSNPSGEKIAMIMLEDPTALMQAKDVADMKNFSIMACGIGSLGGAFRAGGIVQSLVNWGLLEQSKAAELNQIGTQKILAEAKRVGIPDMLTANASDIEKRVKEGFLALLVSGAGADDAIRIGRKAAGR